MGPVHVMALGISKVQKEELSFLKIQRNVGIKFHWPGDLSLNQSLGLGRHHVLTGQVWVIWWSQPYVDLMGRVGGRGDSPKENPLLIPEGGKDAGGVRKVTLSAVPI